MKDVNVMEITDFDENTVFGVQNGRSRGHAAGCAAGADARSGKDAGAAQRAGHSRRDLSDGAHGKVRHSGNAYACAGERAGGAQP